MTTERLRHLARDREVSGATRSGSNFSSVPRPSQAGQAPKGLLKEKRRGSISSMVKPETGQANFSERRRAHGYRSWIVGAVFRGLRGRQRLVGEFRDGQAFAELQGGFECVGQGGAEIGADHEAINHHLDVVLDFLVERRDAVDLIEVTIDLDALEALFLEIGISLRYSPLRPRTMGARR